MRPQHPIFRVLKKETPNLAFKVEWERDPNYEWDGDGPDPADDGAYPHDVIVTAQVIVRGMLIEATDVMGGSYKEPGEVDPGIHGYLFQMLDQALSQLGGFDITRLDAPALRQIRHAKSIVEKAMRRRR